MSVANDEANAGLYRNDTAPGESVDELDRKMAQDRLEQMKTHATYIEKDEVGQLSQEHKDYLISRHGTYELDPIPYASDADPYNWPRWKKVTNLILVAFHAMMGTFNAAAIIPAYEDIAIEFNTTVPEISYLTSLQIAILGGAPLFWRPLSNRYGRRPIFLFSLAAACVCNIGCAESYSYGTMAACRALVAFFISPAGAIGSAVVAETFFKKERAKYMGVWTLLITQGVPVAGFLFGFVAFHVGFRWIYWVLAITHGIQFILYIFLGPESRYLRKGVEHHGGTLKQEYFNFGRIDTAPFRWTEFIHPLKYFLVPSVLIAAAAYSMVFLCSSILITVEIPQLFGPKFEFNPQQLGLQFLSIIIGTFIGEQLGGVSSDWWMNRRAKKTGIRPPPEHRLWLSYPGTILAIVGTIVFLIQINDATPLHWNITPLIGAAIAAVGNQIVTTVLITYAVDCYPDDAASVGVFITFVRQMWGFIGPFWFPIMFENIGLDASAGVCTALMVGVSLVPVIPLQFISRRWRARE